MANDIRNWAKRQTVGDRNAKGILLEIADLADPDGYCTYGIAAIASTLEMSTRTVERGFSVLQEKNLIRREEGEKEAGKFTSKNTQILIPEDDRQTILEARRKREMKRLEETQTPPDILSGGKQEKPSDKMTGGQIVQRSNCQKPSDKLSGGQIVALNDIDKDINISTLEENEILREESLSPRTREAEADPPEEKFDDLPRRERFDDLRSGISVHEMLDLKHDAEFQAYNRKIVEGLKIRHGTRAHLPNRERWEAVIERAWQNEFPAEQSLEVFDLLEEIRELNDGDWTITPNYWEENIPRVNERRRELEKLKKGVKNRNGNKSNKPVGATKSDHLSDDEWYERNSHLTPDYGDGDEDE